MKRALVLSVTVAMVILSGCTSAQSNDQRKVEFQNYTKWVSNRDQQIWGGPNGTKQAIEQDLKLVLSFVNEANQKDKTLSPELKPINRKLIKWQNDFADYLKALVDGRFTEAGQLKDIEVQYGREFTTSLYNYSKKYNIPYTIQ